METISFQSLRQSGREVNSIGGRQLSSGAPTPWIPGSDYPCAPVFSLPQQRPFWKARKGTIAQRRVTHIPFLKHHSSHTFGINRRIFYAALYWSLSNLREDFKSVQLYLKGICYRGCLCRRQRNPVWPTNTQHRQEKRPSAKKLEHNLAQMGGGSTTWFQPNQPVLSSPRSGWGSHPGSWHGSFSVDTLKTSDKLNINNCNSMLRKTIKP